MRPYSVSENGDTASSCVVVNDLTFTYRGVGRKIAKVTGEKVHFYLSLENREYKGIYNEISKCSDQLTENGGSCGICQFRWYQF